MMSQTEKKGKGIIYVATKNERYVAEAFLSATSVKDINPDIHITLYTNLTDSIYSQDDCFDNVISIDTLIRYKSQWAEGQLDRILCLPETPYDYTLHLDTDTRVLSSEITQLFDFLDGSDIAMVECSTDNSYSRLHYGAPMFNVGFILYRKNEKTLELLKSWATLTATHFRYASQEEIPELRCLAHIKDEEICRKLLFMDQVSLVQILSPNVNKFDLKLEILPEVWNYRGSPNNRIPVEQLKISHDPVLRRNIVSHIIEVGKRYRDSGNIDRARAIFSQLQSMNPDNQTISILVASCHG